MFRVSASGFRERAGKEQGVHQHRRMGSGSVSIPTKA